MVDYSDKLQAMRRQFDSLHAGEDEDAKKIKWNKELEAVGAITINKTTGEITEVELDDRIARNIDYRTNTTIPAQIALINVIHGVYIQHRRAQYQGSETRDQEEAAWRHYCITARMGDLDQYSRLNLELEQWDKKLAELNTSLAIPAPDLTSLTEDQKTVRTNIERRRKVTTQGHVDCKPFIELDYQDIYKKVECNLCTWEQAARFTGAQADFIEAAKQLGRIQTVSEEDAKAFAFQQFTCYQNQYKNKPIEECITAWQGATAEMQQQAKEANQPEKAEAPAATPPAPGTKPADYNRRIVAAAEKVADLLEMNEAEKAAFVKKEKEYSDAYNTDRQAEEWEKCAERLGALKTVFMGEQQGTAQEKTTAWRQFVYRKGLDDPKISSSKIQEFLEHPELRRPSAAAPSPEEKPVMKQEANRADDDKKKKIEKYLEQLAGALGIEDKDALSNFIREQYEKFSQEVGNNAEKWNEMVKRSEYWAKAAATVRQQGKQRGLSSKNDLNAYVRLGLPKILLTKEQQESADKLIDALKDGKVADAAAALRAIKRDDQGNELAAQQLEKMTAKELKELYEKNNEKNKEALKSEDPSTRNLALLEIANNLAVTHMQNQRAAVNPYVNPYANPHPHVQARVPHSAITSETHARHDLALALTRADTEKNGYSTNLEQAAELLKHLAINDEQRGVAEQVRAIARMKLRVEERGKMLDQVLGRDNLAKLRQMMINPADNSLNPNFMINTRGTQLVNNMFNHQRDEASTVELKDRLAKQEIIKRGLGREKLTPSDGVILGAITGKTEDGKEFRLTGGNDGRLHVTDKDGKPLTGDMKKEMQRAFAAGAVVLELPGNVTQRVTLEWRQEKEVDFVVAQATGASGAGRVVGR